MVYLNTLLERAQGGPEERATQAREKKEAEEEKSS
jgi:hypothetical protein